MAASVTRLSIPPLAPFFPDIDACPRGRRRITPQAGHALEILGHAIEYLADEYVNEGGLFSAHDPRIEAIQLLMARNREVYFDCPERRTFRARLGSWLAHS